MDYRLTITEPRPYFAEVPYYLWGTVNYDSEGNCKRPTDRDWTWLDLTHRDTDEQIGISSDGTKWTVSGPDVSLARVSLFLSERCHATPVDPQPECRVGTWDHSEALARAARVAKEFASPKLSIFDFHLFWGSWKWIGWFATEFTWVGRWIMLSVLKGDSRGVPLCVDWLKHGTFNPDQSSALRNALRELTGESFDSDAEWIGWYDGSLLHRGAKSRYPEPDFDGWLAELKAEYGDREPTSEIEG